MSTIRRRRPSGTAAGAAALAVRLAPLALVALPCAGCGINNIPTHDEAANAAWAELQDQYRQRVELAPELVAAVRGAGEPGPEVLADVIEARARAVRTPVSPDTLSDPTAFERFERNQDALGSSLRRLVAAVEARTGPTPDADFLSLRDRLEGTENRIAFARDDYAESVRRYNTELRTVPGRWWHAFMYSDMAPKRDFRSASPDAADPTLDAAR